MVGIECEGQFSPVKDSTNTSRYHSQLPFSFYTRAFHAVFLQEIEWRARWSYDPMLDCNEILPHALMLLERPQSMIPAILCPTVDEMREPVQSCEALTWFFSSLSCTSDYILERCRSIDVVNGKDNKSYYPTAQFDAILTHSLLPLSEPDFRVSSTICSGTPIQKGNGSSPRYK